jgi:hypothetical protein
MTPLLQDGLQICKVCSNESLSYSWLSKSYSSHRLEKYFPKFKDGKGNDVALHLIRFHMHICKLGVEFHEDCLMKFFMDTLEGKARLWYEGLKPGILYSLKYFHITFFKHYGESNPSFLVFEDCCEFCEHFIKYLENVFGDEECMNDEIIEAFHEYSSKQPIVAPPLVEDEVDQEIVVKLIFLLLNLMKIFVGPWLWRKVNIMEEKVKRKLRGRMVE